MVNKFTLDHAKTSSIKYYDRRKCPGNVLAISTVWIAAVRLIWAFDFGPEFDDAGNPMPISPENCTSGMTSYVPIRLQAYLELTGYFLQEPTEVPHERTGSE